MNISIITKTNLMAKVNGIIHGFKAAYGVNPQITTNIQFFINGEHTVFVANYAYDGSLFEWRQSTLDGSKMYWLYFDITGSLLSIATKEDMISCTAEGNVEYYERYNDTYPTMTGYRIYHLYNGSSNYIYYQLGHNITDLVGETIDLTREPTTDEKLQIKLQYNIDMH